MKRTLSRNRIVGLALMGLALMLATPQFPAGGEPSPPKPAKMVHRDLEEIESEGILRVITRHNFSSSFLYKGDLFGFDGEITKRFASALGVQLEIVVVSSFEEMHQALVEGRGDIIAGGLTGTPYTENEVNYTIPLFDTDLVLVTYGENDASDPAALRGRRVILPREVLAGLEAGTLSDNNKFGILFEAAPPDEDVENLLIKLVKGYYGIVLVPRSQADMMSKAFDQIHVGAALPIRQPVRFSVRPQSWRLLATLDTFISNLQPTFTFKVLFDRYFTRPWLKKHIEDPYFSASFSRVSPYDRDFYEIAEMYGFDWRLLAAISYHESRFNAQATGPGPSYGLMQLTQSTMRSIKDLSCSRSPRDNIHCAAYLLDRLRGYFREIPEPERTNFVLAAYITGEGYVFKARKLAEEKGLSPNKWFGNVEIGLKELSLEYNRRKGKVRKGKDEGFKASDLARETIVIYRNFKQFLSDAPSPEAPQTIAQAQ